MCCMSQLHNHKPVAKALVHQWRYKWTAALMGQLSEPHQPTRDWCHLKSRQTQSLPSVSIEHSGSCCSILSDIVLGRVQTHPVSHLKRGFMSHHRRSIATWRTNKTLIDATTSPSTMQLLYRDSMSAPLSLMLKGASLPIFSLSEQGFPAAHQCGQ